MAKPKSKEQPYFSQLLVFILKELKNKKNLGLEWSNQWNIVNSVMNILIHDGVSDELKEWWDERKASIAEHFPRNKHCGYSNPETTKLKQGGKFLNYKITGYYLNEFHKGNQRFLIDSVKLKIDQTPIGKSDIARRISKRLLRYFDAEPNQFEVMNNSQLLGTYQNKDYSEFRAIWFVYIAAEMPQKIQIEKENKALGYSFLNTEECIDSGDYFEKLSIKIHIQPYESQKEFLMVSRFSYISPRLSAHHGSSNSLNFKFIFENSQLAKRHTIDSLYVNGIDCKHKMRKPVYFHEATDSFFRKQYIFDNIEESEFYKVERVCTSYLRFPIDDLVYHLPKYTRELSVVIELVDSPTDLVNLFRLSGALFLPAPLDKLKSFFRNRLLLEFEGEDGYPQGSGYRVSVRPIFNLLEYKPDNLFQNKGLSEQEDTEFEDWD